LKRRTVLGHALCSGAALGMIDGARALAIADERSMAATQASLGATDSSLAATLRVDVPSSAWTGAMVPVRIDARRVHAARRIVMLRDAHQSALVASVEFPEGGLPPVVSLPIRLARPCRLRVLVLSSMGWVHQDAQVESIESLDC